VNAIVHALKHQFDRRRCSPMGFYDCRCMATGVSLKGADAALVLLQHEADPYAPIALAIKGNYDRLGSIDGIEEDANTRLVLRFFLEALQEGAFRVDQESLAADGCFPIRTIEHLLRGFERNMNDGPGYAALHGQPVVFTLLARAVWDTIAQAAPPPVEPVSAAFRRLFGPSPVGTRIYAGSLGEVSGHLGELAAVDSFLRSQGLPWQATEGGGQDYPEEMQQYLGEARRAFADSPIILAALRHYADEVGELLEEH
jgi:hypothetical protein